MKPFTGNYTSITAIVLFACIAIVTLAILHDTTKPDTKRRAITAEEDSELLLYDDTFTDEAIRLYTLRSLTASLSRLGQRGGFDCHNRAHELGRRAYELLGNEAFKGCGIECHSGCRHGATEAFFADVGTANLIESMRMLCGSEKIGFDMHQCIHGVGHGLMAWFDYELYDALGACDMIEHEHHQRSCYSGVFMENIVGTVAGDGQVPKGKYHHTEYLTDDPHYPCNAVDKKYAWECYWLQTDHMLNLLGDLTAVGDACTQAPEYLQPSCFHSMGRTASGMFLLDPDESFNLCMAISHVPGKEGCLSGALNNLLWDESQADGAITFCRRSLDTFFENTCYDLLIVQMSEVIPQSSIKKFCNKLPEHYRDRCASQQAPEAIPLSVRSTKEINPYTEKSDGVVSIRYKDGEYTPDTVHVKTGTEVVWINEEETFWPASNIHPTHRAYPGSDIEKCSTSSRDMIFDACEPLSRGARYSFLFTEIGSWRYHDHINPQATGTVIVTK